MTPREIKDKLKRRKITQTEIANRCGVTFQLVHLVIEGKATSRRVEKRLARALGMKVADYRAAREQTAA